MKAEREETEELWQDKMLSYGLVKGQVNGF